MTTRIRFLALIGACGLMLAAPVAQAQIYDLQTMQQEIDSLRADIVALQSQVGSGGISAEALEASGITVQPLDTTSDFTGQEGASAQVRLSQLEERLRTLTGQIEELQFAQRQQAQRIDQLIADVDLRLAALEGGAAGAATGGVAATTGTTGTTGTTEDVVIGETTTVIDDGAVVTTETASVGATLPPGSEMDQYNYAFSLLRQADYDAAEAAFQEFLTMHPNGDLSGNAYYWLGETYYVRNNFQQAAINFLKGYQQFPESTKAPDNLLKLGVTLSRLGKTAEACATFAELSRKFPDAPQNMRDKAAQEAAGAGCG
ncbi:MAG: tol-pal system protein YbgF [Pseudomonadota bacterium]